jgi:hypothetical protein
MPARSSAIPPNFCCEDGFLPNINQFVINVDCPPSAEIMRVIFSEWGILWHIRSPNKGNLKAIFEVH